MKKLIMMLAAVVALAAACQPEEQFKDDLKGGYQFDFDITVGGFDNTKADATIGWTEGEKVYVFFQPAGGSMVTDAYAEFTYDGENGWTPNSYLAPGALGESGKMAAVYVPYLATGKGPEYDSATGDWVIDGGNVYFSCVSGAEYTVVKNLVRGTLELRIPYGYIQFEVDADIASDGDKLACNIVDAYTCVQLKADMTFTETGAVADKLMTGKKDGAKVYFWGKANEKFGTEPNCEFVVRTAAHGDIPKIVTADKVSRNHAYRLLFTTKLEVDVEDKAVGKVKSEVMTANTGTLPAYLRAAIVANCEDADGVILEPYAVGDITTNSDFALPADWTSYWIYNAADGWYYYKYIVPGESRTEIDLFTTFTAPASCYSDSSVDHVNMQVVLQGVDAYDNLGMKDVKQGVTDAGWPAAVISALETTEKGTAL